MAKIKVTQVISANGETGRQKANLRCLGIRKMNQSVIIEDTPVAQGQIAKVAHLVKVEPVKK
ncbi:MAG: 50S ribosomal protein L30 [Bacteroidales bacterium]|nr:50S ribosomal protein L30 [Candidatus Cryptobacteroides aphodequi]